MNQQLTKFLAEAEHSPFKRGLLNKILAHTIPFNKPHSLDIKEISPSTVKVKLPYKKSNLNHVRGLHACGLATAAEYTSGLLLLRRLGSEDYRLIMKSLSVDYVYQGKSDATASFKLSDAEYAEKISLPLESDESVLFDAVVEVHDAQQNLLCTATITWQIKPWRLVKTKS
ncbi:MAG: DUF4442 domain-containing protein [Bdellovibrionales bacterium]|nr:DUF4442 domain-containing protein [Bdellovibrionales bacterium]